jgi:hypothetical protein
VTLAFVALAFFAIGFEIRRLWTVAMPFVLGVLYLVVARRPGTPFLGDTPVPFLVVLATAATAAGIRIGKQRVTRRAG